MARKKARRDRGRIEEGSGKNRMNEACIMEKKVDDKHEYKSITKGWWFANGLWHFKPSRYADTKVYRTLRALTDDNPKSLKMIGREAVKSLLRDFE